METAWFQLPTVLCGVVAANLSIMLVVGWLRRDDLAASSLIPAATLLSGAVFLRVAMLHVGSDTEVLTCARLSYACALLVVPATLWAVRAGTSKRARWAAWLTTTCVAGVVWVDPVLLTGDVIAATTLFGTPARIAELSARSIWLLPYAAVTSYLVWVALRKLAPADRDVVTGVRVMAVGLAAASVPVILADTRLIPATHLEVVTATIGTTALAAVMLERSRRTVDGLLSAIQELEAQRRACGEDARRLDRMVRLGADASTLVEDIDAPSRELAITLHRAVDHLQRAFVHDPTMRARVEGVLAQSLRAARRVTRTVHRVREFATANVVTTMRCEARECLGAAIGMLDHIARHQVTLNVEVEGEATVAGNAGQLTRMFVLTLRSALWAMQDQRGLLHVKLEEHGETISLSIRSPAGMVRLPAPRLLEPYGDKSATLDGFGLELATAYRLVDAFGGEMQVEEPFSVRIALPTIGGA